MKLGKSVDFGDVEGLEDLAVLLGFAPQNLYYLLNIADDLYHPVLIPKRNGTGDREIHIPCPELRGVQKQILKVILFQESSHKNAFAYKRGISVVDAARRISGPNYLLKIDIRNFFPNIGIDRIYSFFFKMGFNSSVSQLLAKLTTFEGRLVQGAPTSPSLSNLIFFDVDELLTRFSNSWSMQYIRYSDDLFLFGDRDFKYRLFSSRVRLILRNSGFQINHEKTRYFRSGQPRYTLGITTHSRTIGLPRKTKRNYRAAFFKASRDVEWARKNYDKLKGMAEWYKAIYGKDDCYMDYCSILKNIKSLKIHTPFLI